MNDFFNRLREDDFDEWRMRASELTEYAAKVEQARLNHPALPIRFGLEVDFLPGQEPWICEMADLHDWDYFIGSVHYVGDWAIDNPATLNKWRDRDTMEVWSAYFKNLTDAAATGLFQIIGHADLPKKFGFVPEADCTPLGDGTHDDFTVFFALHLPFFFWEEVEQTAGD